MNLSVNIFPPTLCLIAGIVLRANADWFHGAHLIGTILFWLGIAGYAFVVVLIIAFGLLWKKVRRDRW